MADDGGTGAVNSTAGSGAVYSADGIRVYGLDAEVERKLQAKRDAALETDCLRWLHAVLNEPLPPAPLDFAAALRSGELLCRAVNALQPGAVAHINTRPVALMHMENLGLYLKACWTLGVPSAELFVTSDLYLGRNLPAVAANVHALSRLAAAQGWTRVSPVHAPLVQTEPKPRTHRRSHKPSRKWPAPTPRAPVYVTDLESAGPTPSREAELLAALAAAQAAAAEATARAEREKEKRAEAEAQLNSAFKAQARHSRLLHQAAQVTERMQLELTTAPASPAPPPSADANRRTEALAQAAALAAEMRQQALVHEQVQAELLAVRDASARRSAQLKAAAAQELRQMSEAQDARLQSLESERAAAAVQAQRLAQELERTQASEQETTAALRRELEALREALAAAHAGLAAAQRQLADEQRRAAGLEATAARAAQQAAVELADEREQFGLALAARRQAEARVAALEERLSGAASAEEQQRHVVELAQELARLRAQLETERQARHAEQVRAQQLDARLADATALAQQTAASLAVCQADVEQLRAQIRAAETALAAARLESVGLREQLHGALTAAEMARSETGAGRERLHTAQADLARTRELVRAAEAVAAAARLELGRVQEDAKTQVAARDEQLAELAHAVRRARRRLEGSPSAPEELAALRALYERAATRLAPLLGGASPTPLASVPTAPASARSEIPSGVGRLARSKSARDVSKAQLPQTPAGRAHGSPALARPSRAATASVLASTLKPTAPLPPPVASEDRNEEADDAEEPRLRKRDARRLKELVHALLTQSDAAQDVAAARKAAKCLDLDPGRRLFIRTLKHELKETQKLELGPVAFELLLSLYRACLAQMAEAGAYDLRACKIIMYTSQALFCRQAGGKQPEYLQEHLLDAAIWRRPSYWDEFFWAEVNKQFRQQRRAMQDDSLDADTFTNLFVPLVLSSFAHDMILTWRLEPDMVRAWALELASANNLSRRHVEAVQQELADYARARNDPRVRRQVEDALKRRIQQSQALQQLGPPAPDDGDALIGTAAKWNRMSRQVLAGGAPSKS